MKPKARNEQGAGDTVSRIEAAGGRAAAVALDVSQTDTFSAFKQDVSRVLAEHWDSQSMTYLVNLGQGP